MPQGLGRNLYPDLSVRENIAFFSRLFGQSRSERAWRITELLGATGLAPFADRPAKKLSGGMRQKLGLCCSLIHDPDLLILDEPTTGVDPLSRRQFWELIDRDAVAAPGNEPGGGDRLYGGGRAVRLADCHERRPGAGQRGRRPTCKHPDRQRDAWRTAFIALLPAAQRAGHTTIQIPPRRSDGSGAGDRSPTT